MAPTLTPTARAPVRTAAPPAPPRARHATAATANDVRMQCTGVAPGLGVCRPICSLQWRRGARSRLLARGNATPSSCPAAGHGQRFKPAQPHFRAFPAALLLLPAPLTPSPPPPTPPQGATQPPLLAPRRRRSAPPPPRHAAPRRRALPRCPFTAPPPPPRQPAGPWAAPRTTCVPCGPVLGPAWPAAAAGHLCMALDARSGRQRAHGAPPPCHPLQSGDDHPTHPWRLPGYLSGPVPVPGPAVWR